MQARRNKDGYMTFLSEEQEKKIDDLMEEFSRKEGMSTKELIARLNPVTIDEFFHELREKIRNYKSDK
jgi:glucose-6-phosphate-specific signal transduction histidine kinase